MRAKIGEIPEDQSQYSRKKRGGSSAVDDLSGCGFMTISFIRLLPSVQEQPIENQRSMLLGSS